MEVSESCNLCGKPNDQMLMLACVHDPCINCAASTYAQQIHIKGQSKELYLCEVCNEETLLDNSTIAELTALASSVLKIPTKSVKTGTRKKQTQSTPLTQSIPQAPLKKVIYYCKQHGEEEISYYCFRCWLNICPECAIHGEHKEHEVKLIKKAISEVKSQYQALVSQTGQSQATMTRLKDQFLRLIKETNDRHTRQKNLVSRQFQQLRSQLQNKEKQLLRELEELNRANVATITAFLQTINSSYEEGNKVKRTIEYIGKKDEVLVLEDFKRIGELQEKLQTLSRVSENLSGQSLMLNTELLQQVMNQTADSLNTVKISLKREPINSMEILATPLRGGHT